MSEAKVSTGAAIALAIVEVLYEEGIITQGQQKVVLLRALTKIGQMPGEAEASELLAKLAREISGNG